MLCSLSGDVARDPVISVKSGHVFERSLLMKHLERTGQDPVSGEDMSPDTDIIAVKTANPIVRPRPTANSLPALINTFQDEWDALMLETYSLRKQLHSTRQELSHALYRYDAACRVIARLKAERDTARSPSAQMDIVEEPASAGTPVVPSELAKSWQLYSEKVSACRKEAFRSPPESLATKEQIGTYEKTSSHALHLVSKPGIMCVDAHAVDPSLIVTGGVDARVVVFDASSEKVRDTLKGHERKVDLMYGYPRRCGSNVDRSSPWHCTMSSASLRLAAKTVLFGSGKVTTSSRKLLRLESCTGAHARVSRSMAWVVIWRPRPSMRHGRCWTWTSPRSSTSSLMEPLGTRAAPSIPTGLCLRQGQRIPSWSSGTLGRTRLLSSRSRYYYVLARDGPLIVV